MEQWNNDSTGDGWLVVFYVPPTARSFRDGTPIYSPLWRTWSSVNTPFPPGIESRAVTWQAITLPLRHASSILSCEQDHMYSLFGWWPTMVIIISKFSFFPDFPLTFLLLRIVSGTAKSNIDNSYPLKKYGNKTWCQHLQNNFIFPWLFHDFNSFSLISFSSEFFPWLFPDFQVNGHPAKFMTYLASGSSRVSRFSHSVAMMLSYLLGYFLKISWNHIMIYELTQYTIINQLKSITNIKTCMIFHLKPYFFNFLCMW